MALDSPLNETIEKVSAELLPYLKAMKVEISPVGKFRCLNPAHQDDTPSANIVPNTDSKIWHCFGCGISCNVFGTAHFLESLPQSGPGFVNVTLKSLCARLGVPFPEVELTAAQKQLLEIQNAYREAAMLVRYSTYDKELQECRYADEFIRRQWDVNVGFKYGVGFIEDYPAYLKHLANKGYSADFLKTHQLDRKDIFGPDTMIFTICDVDGTPIAFAARYLKWQHGDKRPKYVNTGADNLLYHKGSTLYGLHVAKRFVQEQGVYIVEGYGDWIAMQEKGIHNCVAIGGTALTREHLQTLISLQTAKIVLCLDNDSGGREALARILDDIIADTPIKTEIMFLPDDQDPEDYLLEHTVGEWNNIPVLTGFQWRMRNLDKKLSPEEKADKMVPLILTEPNLLTRERMARDVADFTNVRLSVIRDQLDKLSSIEKYKASERLNSLANGLIKDVRRSPGSMREILSTYSGLVEQLVQSTSTDNIGVEETLALFDTACSAWKAQMDSIVGIRTGWKDFDEALNGLQEGKAVGLCGKPNHGKSSMFASITYAITQVPGQNAMVIYHTVDDPVETTESRLLSVISGLATNEIINPLKYFGLKDGDTYRRDAKNNLLVNPERKPEYQAWNAAREILRKLLADGRIVVKGALHGATLGYTETMIKYYRAMYPDRRILLIFDNFHKAQDFQELDLRARVIRMSSMANLIAEKHKIAFLGSLQYHKVQEGFRPTNYNIAESAQPEYDLKVVLNLYNELRDVKDKARLKVPAERNFEGVNPFNPILQVEVGKNKQNSFQDTLYFKLVQWNSRVTPFSTKEAGDLIHEGREQQMGTKASLTATPTPAS